MSNYYLGDMLNNPKFADVISKNLKKYLKNCLKEQNSFWCEPQ